MLEYTVTDLGVDASRRITVPHGSNSQRVGYSICPAAYRFSRIDGVPERPTSDLLRGTALHAGLAAALLATMKNASREEALIAGNAAIDAHLREQFKRYEKLGVLWLPTRKNGPLADQGSVGEDARDALPLVFDLLLERYRILTVEHGFLIHLPACDPMAAFADFAGVDRQTGEVAVLDAKTGLAMRSLSDIHEDDALIAYSAGMNAVLHELPARIGYVCVVYGGGQKTRTIRVDFVRDVDGAIGIPYDPERLRRVATHQRALAAAKAAKLFLPMQST